MGQTSGGKRPLVSLTPSETHSGKEDRRFPALRAPTSDSSPRVRNAYAQSRLRPGLRLCSVHAAGAGGLGWVGAGRDSAWIHCAVRRVFSSMASSRKINSPTAYIPRK